MNPTEAIAAMPTKMNRLLREKGYPRFNRAVRVKGTAESSPHVPSKPRTQAGAG